MTLNLLVSILGDIHSRVMSVYKSERLRAKCRLINENEILFNRARLFQSTKYVVRAEIEHIESSDGDKDNDRDTPNDSNQELVSKMKQLINQSEERQISNFKLLKEKVHTLHT